MGKLFTASFWADAFERAVSTGAQAVILGLSLDAGGLLTLNVNTLTAALSFFAGGFVLTVLKAIAASYVADPDSAGFVDLDR